MGAVDQDLAEALACDARYGELTHAGAAGRQRTEIEEGQSIDLTGGVEEHRFVDDLVDRTVVSILREEGESTAPVCGFDRVQLNRHGFRGLLCLLRLCDASEGCDQAGRAGCARIPDESHLHLPYF